MENFEYDLGNSTYIRNISYDIDSIIDKIRSTDNTEEIKQIVLYQHDKIFTHDNLVNNNINGIQELFMDINFLNILDNISGLLVPKLSETEIIFINKIIYDFFEYSSNITDKKVSDIQHKMNSIAATINQALSIALLARIGVNNATKLSILSRSSFKFETVIHRVNMFMYNSSFSDFEIKEIFRVIYGFDKIGESEYTVYQIGVRKFTSIFTYSMLEKCIRPDNKDFMIQFNRVSLVILKLLKELSFSDLEAVLLNYGNIINLYNINDPNKLRFLIKEHITEGEPMYTFIRNIENIHDIIIY